MRPVVVHYHIFKNAGSTIDSILQKNFGNAWGSIDGSNPWDTLDSDTILRYALENRNLKAVSSHQARLPEPVHKSMIFLPLIFLRHPIDRVGSVYSFERRQPLDSPSLGARIARTSDFASYVKWRLGEGNGAVIRNFQTVFLSARQRDMRVATAEVGDLKIAMERISQLPFFGIVEQFDCSLSRMKNYLRRYFGKLDTSHIITNSSPDRKSTIHERLEETESLLGATLYRELLDMNSLDMELYEFSVKFMTTSEAEVSA